MPTHALQRTTFWGVHITTTYFTGKLCRLTQSTPTYTVARKKVERILYDKYSFTHTWLYVCVSVAEVPFQFLTELQLHAVFSAYFKYTMSTSMSMSSRLLSTLSVKIKPLSSGVNERRRNFYQQNCTVT